MFVAGDRSTIDMSSFSVFKSESELKMLYLGSFRDLMTDQQIYFLCNTRKYNLKIDHIIVPHIEPYLVPCEIQVPSTNDTLKCF